jgi:hypothetical protein
MKNRNIYQLVFCCLFFLVSCEDQLDIEPTFSISDDAALSSEASINKLLIGTYQVAGNANSHGGFVQVFSDLLGADDQVTWNGTYTEPREVLFKEMLAGNIIINNVWKNLYRTVNQCNLVLAHLDVIKDDAEKSRIEGEARFLRALNYFELVRLFGNKTLGVPLRLDPIVDYGANLSFARNPIAEVYDAIFNDLNLAFTLLPDDNDVYADKYAAEALLARVHLYLGHYDEARDAADDVINNGGKALSGSFADAFNHNEDTAEDIFAMQVTSQSGDNQLIDMYASEDFGGRGGDISINQAYLDFFDDPNDERSLFFYENPKGDRLTGKYINQFGNVPIIRLAEMLLIRAECNVQLGTTAGAAPLDDVNAIRQRSGAGALASVTIDEILAERMRELAFEGFWIYDVKRTHGTIQGIPYDDLRLEMPIPQSEMDTNSLMEQNEGYL